MTIAEPKISDVVVEKVTFFLVQPHKRRCPKVSDTGARNALYQGLFPPAVIDWESSWYYHDNLKEMTSGYQKALRLPNRYIKKRIKPNLP